MSEEVTDYHTFQGDIIVYDDEYDTEEDEIPTKFQTVVNNLIGQNGAMDNTLTSTVTQILEKKGKNKSLWKKNEDGYVYIPYEIGKNEYISNAAFEDQKQEIAKAIKYLYENEKEAKRLGVNGRNAILREFNWEKESQRLSRIYEEVLK